jgi:hypothetical protein
MPGQVSRLIIARWDCACTNLVVHMPRIQSSREPGRRSRPGPTRPTSNLLARNGANPFVWLVQLPLRILALVGLGVVLNRHARQQRDQLHPVGFLKCNPRITELDQLAWTLAANEREDEDAIQMLRDKAARRRNDLRWAAAHVRARRWIDEHRIAYRANELLLAAAEDRPIDAGTVDQEAWFKQIDALSDGWNDAAFTRLVALQPRLADVERSITRSRHELRRAKLEGRELAKGRVAVWRQIEHALDPLVGPRADSADQLVRSHRAYELAERILHRREDVAWL